MGKKDEKTKTKAAAETKQREKSRPYVDCDPFKVPPNRPAKKAAKKATIKPS
jgi:hypothetical protein